MNRLKYLFTYTIVAVIALTSNSCKKDTPLNLSECKSDCFEIRGTLWNASADKPEANRKINVIEWIDGAFSADKNYGYVTTNSNGEFVVKLNKSEIVDTSRLDIALHIAEKAGYINDFMYLQISPQRYKLHEVNNISLEVFEEATLNFNITNTHALDTFYVYEVSHKFKTNYLGHALLKSLAPGSTVQKTITTAAGLDLNIAIRYRHPNSTTNIYMYDTIVVSKDQINNYSFDLK